MPAPCSLVPWPVFVSGYRQHTNIIVRLRYQSENTAYRPNIEAIRHAGPRRGLVSDWRLDSRASHTLHGTEGAGSSARLCQQSFSGRDISPLGYLSVGRRTCCSVVQPRAVCFHGPLMNKPIQTPTSLSRERVKFGAGWPELLRLPGSAAAVPRLCRGGDLCS